MLLFFLGIALIGLFIGAEKFHSAQRIKRMRALSSAAPYSKHRAYSEAPKYKLKAVATLSGVFVLAAIISLSAAGMRSPHQSSPRPQKNSSSEIEEADQLPKSIAEELNERAEIEDFCLKGVEECQSEIAHRTVQIRTQTGLGTGFIIFSDRERMLILTASHVIREGNGFESSITEGVKVWDPFLQRITYPEIACAFFTKAHSDVALIQIPNRRPQIYSMPEIAENPAAIAGTNVVTVSNRRMTQERWTYKIRGKDARKKYLVLHDLASPGDSGSAVFSEQGLFLGVLIAGQWREFGRPGQDPILFDKQTIVTYGSGHIEELADSRQSIEALVGKGWQDTSKYICRDYDLH